MPCGKQDYDLQAITQASSSFAEYASGDVGNFYNKVGKQEDIGKTSLL